MDCSIIEDFETPAKMALSIAMSASPDSSGKEIVSKTGYMNVNVNSLLRAQLVSESIREYKAYTTRNTASTILTRNVLLLRLIH
jgi:hypothetical protein